MLELTQKSERTIQGLELKVASLEREVTTHHAGVEELSREHRVQMDTLREEKAMLEVGGYGGVRLGVVGCGVQMDTLREDKAMLEVGGCGGWVWGPDGHRRPC